MKLQELVEFASCLIISAKLDTSPIIDEEKIKIVVDDSFEARIINNTLSVMYQRHAYVDPYQFFDIEAKYRIIWNIVEGQVDNLKKMLENVDLEGKRFLVDTAPREASLLIAQLSQALGLSPLISEPYFKSNQN